MSMSLILKNYLERWGAEYDLLQHDRTGSSLETAEAAHVPGDKLAKCVLTEDYRGYLMVVVPASHQVEFDLLDDQLDRKVSLATEEELQSLFEDCEPGAMPPMGEAYGIDVALDDSLANCEDVYFEAGNHTELIHMRGEVFRSIMAGAEHGQFSSHL